MGSSYGGTSWWARDAIWVNVTKPTLELIVDIFLWLPRLLLSIQHVFTLWLLKPVDDFCTLLVSVQDQVADFFL